MAPTDSPKTVLVYKRQFSVQEASKDQSICTCSIRTDFILQNIFSHVIKPVECFPPIRASTYEEKNTFSKLLDIVDDFIKKYQTSLKYLLSRYEIKLELNTLTSFLIDISNEMFSEGITWSQIVAFFAFVGKFTAQCVNKIPGVNVVEVIYQCFAQIVRENLERWIEDHGGWEGILTLSASHENRNELPSTPMEKMSSPRGSVKVWARNILHGSVRMIGTFAHIANAAQAYP